MDFFYADKTSTIQATAGLVDTFLAETTVLVENQLVLFTVFKDTTALKDKNIKRV